MANKAPENIETARLVLRRPMLSDASDIFRRYASDPVVTRLLGWPRHRTLEDTIEFLKLSDSEWDQWPAGPYLVFSKEHGLLLGSTGLGAFQTNTNTAETGYVLAKDSWGKGYATEVLQAMVEVASLVGVKQLRALVHPDNSASQHVLEKCDFERQDDVTKCFEHEFPNLDSTNRASNGGNMQKVFCYSKALA